MKKGFACALLLALGLLVLTASAENLVWNADFSDLDDGGMPAGWYTDAYDGGKSQFTVDAQENGESCLMVFNFDNNDARWVQDIAVEPNTEYEIRCRILAEDCSYSRETADGYLSCRGANISILNSSAYSDSVYETEGEWQEVVLYGKTGSKQDVLQLALRVGGYSGDGTGVAWFKDVSVVKTEAPDDAFVLSLATYEPYSASSWQSSDPEMPQRITETLALIAFGIVLAGLALIACARRSLARGPLEENERPPLPAIVALLSCAMIVRLYFAVRVRGYAVDINDFMIWGENFLSDGFSFYESSGLHDYPPLYMAFLGLMSAVRRLFGIAYDSSAHLILVKLAPIACDLWIAALLYRLMAKRTDAKRALILFAALLFNPVFIADSAAWGQADSVMTLFLVLCVIYALDGKWHIALPVYALSILIKPQTLLFGPLGLAALIVDAVGRIRKRQSLKSILAGLVIALGIAYAVAAPFALREEGSNLLYPFVWLWNTFLSASMGYEYLSVNACNLYVLLNKNWGSLSYYPSLANLAWLLFALSYLVSVGICALSKTRKSLPLAGAALISLIYAFAPMMHERYLFPAIALLAIAYAQTRDRRVLVSLLAVTVTQFLNITLVLQGGTVAEFASYGHLSGEEQTLNAIISAVNMLSALWTFWIAFDILVLKHVRELSPAKRLPDSPLERLARKNDWHLRLRRADYLTMAAITAVYSVFAFTNLGSTKAPQTYWENTQYKEQVVFDLGDVKTFRMTYYGGISSSPFTVALSNDGERWTEENYAVYNEGEIFRWLWYAPQTYSGGEFANAHYDAASAVDTGPDGAYVAYPSGSFPYPLQTARYVRLTVMGIGLPLHEVGFWDVDSETLYPVMSVTGSRPDADYSLLVDEQDTVAFTPSYMNGTYFDEIYHARTAYELLHGKTVLEWSHPHLGKLLIMVGVELFGMTPFGWRFMGALVGVLMLPVMYLLVKQLTKKQWLATLGMLLLAVDSMHFTQSRIATVDSYAVFFIMLMYLFMFRYFQMNLHKQKLWRTLIPLGLSGISMGLACASKWIGIYAAAGLAILFFITVFQRFGEYRAMKKQADAGSAQAVKAFPKKLILTLLFCVLAFVIVPVVIYYFCYYRHFAPTGGLTVQKVWDMQVQMYNYHKGLSGDTHFFRSPWYEWPVIGKPMWYYSSDMIYLGRGVVSSISCMGNPAVWWTGLAALIALIILLAIQTCPGYDLLLIAVGFASQYLPWVLVPRSTFIYHYFASVPFIILAFLVLLQRWEKRNVSCARIAGYTVAGMAVLLFLAFYPLESGYPCSYDYAMLLRWFDWYNFQLQ